MRQIEISRTLVFDASRHARSFFEALVAENLDIGRPETVELPFTGHAPHSRRAHPIVNRTRCKTKIVTRDTLVTMNAFFKHSRIKQYFKDGRALRIETVVNSPRDLQCLRRLEHMDELQHKARDINARLLDTERVGQGCVLASPAFERVAQSTLTEDGRRAPALRFARRLRSWPCSAPYVSATPPSDSPIGACVRPGDPPPGQCIALLYTKVHNRLLRPLLAADKAPAPPQLRQALSTIDHHIRGYIDNARPGNAA